MSATFEAREDADPPTLVVQGEVDLANASELSDALARLARDDAQTVAVDLSQVGYFDSAGIRVLFEHAGRCKLHVRVPAGATIARAIEVSGLAAVVTIEQ